MEPKKDEYDVVIVGAGPAGMFAADEIAGKKSVLIIDQGRDIKDRDCKLTRCGTCAFCKPCDIMNGVGGAGTFSDGTLNLRPDIGGDLAKQLGDPDYAWEVVNYVDRKFVEYGAPEEMLIPDQQSAEQLMRMAVAQGARFLPINQRHIGSDFAPKVIGNHKKSLEERGVEFLLNTKVKDLIVEKQKKNGKVCKMTYKGVILAGGMRIKAGWVIIAPGRIGADWMAEMVKKHGIPAKDGPIDIGVRLEVPRVSMDIITKVNHDPKFHIYTKTYRDFVRTFCTNEHGYVVREAYENYVTTNGHSLKGKQSDNTNFAFLMRVELTEPIAGTGDYGMKMAQLAGLIGGSKPIVQTYGDLRQGRRSKPEGIAKNLVVPTLKDVTPGDIGMALTYRILIGILEGLEVLNEIIPGILTDSTLIYAPEVKFYSKELHVNKDMKVISEDGGVIVENLFAAGDGAGLSRDIINAAATGVIAGRGILKETSAVEMITPMAMVATTAATEAAVTAQ